MIREKLSKILSLNGISILIGIIGGVFGLFSIFIDWNSRISIKWFALIIIIVSFVLLISFLMIFEFNKLQHQQNETKIQIIKFELDYSMILIEKNKALEFSQIVTIYYSLDNFLVPFALGYVENIHENYTQIKIVKFEEDFKQKHSNEYIKFLNNNKESLDSIQIKNYLRYNGS